MNKMCFRVCLYAIRVIPRFMAAIHTVSKHLNTMIVKISYKEHTSVINTHTNWSFKLSRLRTLRSKSLNDIPFILGFAVKHFNVVRTSTADNNAMSVRIFADSLWITLNRNSENGLTTIHTPHTQSMVAAICDDHTIGIFLHTHVTWKIKLIIFFAFTSKSAKKSPFAVKYLHAIIVTVSNNNVTSSSAAYSSWIMELRGSTSSFSTSHRE